MVVSTPAYHAADRGSNLLLLMSFSMHSICGVLCTVLFCLAGCARLPQNFSGCYCKILEVKIKMGEKNPARTRLDY